MFLLVLTDITQEDNRNNTNVTAEIKLYKDLVDDKNKYRPEIRPALNPRDPIKIKFHVQIVSLDGIVSEAVSNERCAQIK